MTYKEFCARVYEELGRDIFWPTIGHLYKIYTSDHLEACLLKIPLNKKNLPTFQKTKYYASVCRNSAGPGDVIKKGKKLEIKREDLSI